MPVTFSFFSFSSCFVPKAHQAQGMCENIRKLKAPAFQSGHQERGPWELECMEEAGERDPLDLCMKPQDHL